MASGILADGARILTINGGSSSLKFALFRTANRFVALECAGTLDRIGQESGHFLVHDSSGRMLHDERISLPDHPAALRHSLAWLESQPGGARLDGAGHRLVHGGPQYTQPQRITSDVLESLKALIPLAPGHLPSEIAAIEALTEAYPDLPQVACFDTAFHRHMPRVAQLIGLPRDVLKDDILRYGFHGLSYEYILGELTREAGPAAAHGRVVIAHLGNGSSMVAVAGGQSRDTTMGFTPLSGLVMSTRPGDMDPGVLLFLLQSRGLSLADLDSLLNRKSGLLGIAGTSSDMRDLLSQAASDPHAAEAVDLFCYAARKALGGLVAVLGGLDTLVFTGGIGENAAEVRRCVCANLAFLGIEVDAARNEAGAPVISSDTSQVTVRVMKTNEELMIARHTIVVLGEGAHGD